MQQALKVCRLSTKKLAQTQQETGGESEKKKKGDKTTKLPRKLVTLILQFSLDRTDTRNDESHGVAFD